MLLFILVPAILQVPALFAAQQPSSPPAQQPTPDAGSGAALQAGSNQAISQTGLLPVYGVDLRVDPAWVDGSQFPSQSASFPNSGTTAAFQQIWSALQAGGYNVLRIPLDVRDTTAAANRAANLCVWAKSNNVQLIFAIAGGDPGKPIPTEFPNKASDFVKAMVGLMRGNNGQYLGNYSQIMALQVEHEANHPGRHGGMKEVEAQKLVLAAAHALRSAESDALSGSGLSVTPLTTSASFDFDLVSAGGIAGGTLTEASYSQAYQALKQFLSGFAASPDLDLLIVDWYPGSLGGGGVEKTPEFLKSLLADVPGKQLVLGTGFSTAFRSTDDQKRLFTTSFANLSDFRASNGTGCLFAGVIFREALNGKNPNPNPPRPTLPGDMNKWDWSAKAAELTAMWTQGKKSEDMKWWLTKVENNMGLVSLQTDASGNVAASPLPAQQGMMQIASAVNAADSQMAATPAVTPATTPDANGAVPSTGAAPTSSADPNASPYGQPTAQAPQTTTQAPGDPASAYGAVPANNFTQAPQSAPNPYAAAATAYTQPGCTPNPVYPQSTDPSAPYAQAPAACPVAATPVPGMASGFQAFAQQGMMGLLNNVLQRLSGTVSGAGRSGFNSANPGYNAANNYSNPGPYSNSASDPNNPANAYNTNGYNNPATYNGSTPSASDPNNPANAYNANSYTNPASTPTSGSMPPNSGTYSGMPSQPGGSVPLAIQIAPQDISIQPTSPQVGTSATINVNLHNQASADASGLIVQAGGSDGTTLVQQTNVHVAPNSSAVVQLMWSPSVASSSYGITVSVSDGSGNMLTSAQVGPFSVSSPSSSTAANNNASSGNSTTGPATQNVGGTASSGSTNQNLGNTASGGGNNDSGSTTGGVASVGSSTPCATNTPVNALSPPGSISPSTSNCNTSGATGSGASGGTGSGRTNGNEGSSRASNPIGSVTLSRIQVGIPGQKAAAGQPASVVVPLLNPYSVPLNNLQGTLLIDGQNVQTQSLDIVLPQQSRSLVFQAVIFRQSGKHQMVVNVVNQRPGANPLTSTMMRSINIVDASSATVAGNTTQGPSGTSASGTTGAGASGTSSGNASTMTAGSGDNGTSTGVPSAGSSGTPSTVGGSSTTSPVSSANGNSTTTATSPASGASTPTNTAIDGSSPATIAGNSFASGTTSIAGATVRSVLPNAFVIGHTVLPSGASAPTNSQPAANSTGRPNPQMATSSAQNTSIRATSPAPQAAGVTSVPPRAASSASPVRAIGAASATSPSSAAVPAIAPGATAGTAPPSANAGPNTPSASPNQASAASPSTTSTAASTPPAVRAIGGAAGVRATTPNAGLPARPGPATPATSQANSAAGAASPLTATPPAASAPASQPPCGLVRPGPNSVAPRTAAPVSNALNRPGPASATSTSSAPAQVTPSMSNALNRPGPAGSSTPSSSSNLLPGRPVPGTPTSTGPPATPAQAAINSQGTIDLSVTTADMRINPVTPRVGQMATFAALIRNLGTANVQGAVVVFNLVVNGVQAGASQPMAFNVPSRGTFQASWSALVPAGKQYQVIVTVNARGDLNLSNNRAALAFAIASR